MPIQCRFNVVSIKQAMYAQGYPLQTEVILFPVYDQSIEEDRRFNAATPMGELKMIVDNPAALEQLQLGKAFYVDFTPVPLEADKPAPGSADPDPA